MRNGGRSPAERAAQVRVTVPRPAGPTDDAQLAWTSTSGCAAIRRGRRAPGTRGDQTESVLSGPRKEGLRTFCGRLRRRPGGTGARPVVRRGRSAVPPPPRVGGPRRSAGSRAGGGAPPRCRRGRTRRSGTCPFAGSAAGPSGPGPGRPCRTHHGCAAPALQVHVHVLGPHAEQVGFDLYSSSVSLTRSPRLHADPGDVQECCGQHAAHLVEQVVEC